LDITIRKRGRRERQKEKLPNKEMELKRNKRTNRKRNKKKMVCF
jgi:hypothetical protein